jgi:AhpD family alkylhydroperoxidase
MDFLRMLSLRRKKAHAMFIKMDSKVYKAFLDLEKATFREGKLSTKTKELIAVGISAATNCESCIQWHTEYAIKAGATEEEILESLEVAIEIGGGHAISTARIAFEVMEKLKNPEYQSAEY